MHEQKSDNLEARGKSTDAVIFVHAGESGPPVKRWLDKLQALGMPVFSHGDYAACTKTRNNYSELGQLLGELHQQHRQSRY